MAKKIKELEQYTEATQAVIKFREKHSAVFERFDALVLMQGEAETELKTAVREKYKDNVANDEIRVTYAPTFKRYYDAETVLKMATPKQRKALEDAEAIITEIDTPKLEELVEKGEVDIKIKQKAFREVEQTPRVIIKEAPKE